MFWRNGRVYTYCFMRGHCKIKTIDWHTTTFIVDFLMHSVFYRDRIQLSPGTETVLESAVDHLAQNDNRSAGQRQPENSPLVPLAS